MTEVSKISIAKSFALLLETACEQYETLLRLVEGKVTLNAEKQLQARAAFCIRMTLAKSFIATVVRARRLCEHGAGELAVSREHRKSFLAELARVVPVRDVNEHGYDANKQKSEITEHLHADESVVVDETSLVILGPQKILMGPLNLADIYPVVSKTREMAGFRALRSREVEANTA